MRRLMSLDSRAESGEMTGSSRWMVSYADFITLLFVMFLVLYASAMKNVPPPAPAGTQQMPGASVVVKQQDKLVADLTAALQGLVDTGDLSLERRPNGLLLEIKDTALFAVGTAQPAPQASSIVARIAAVLAGLPNGVVVEGHTDSTPIQTAQYPSNWELSSARAAAIVRSLQEAGLASGRLSASGLADTKPKADNGTVEGRGKNRRVSLLVLKE